MDKTKVMIIDEQPYFRAGVRQAHSQHADVDGLDCDPGPDPMAMSAASLPDIILLGSDLTTHSGLELG